MNAEDLHRHLPITGIDGLELMIEFEAERAPPRVGPGFFFGARSRRHAVRNAGDLPARVLILSAPSVRLDHMFAQLDAATAGGMPGFERLAAIAAKYGVILDPPHEMSRP